MENKYLIKKFSKIIYVEDLHFFSGSYLLLSNRFLNIQ